MNVNAPTTPNAKVGWAAKNPNERMSTLPGLGNIPTSQSIPNPSALARVYGTNRDNIETLKASKSSGRRWRL